MSFLVGSLPAQCESSEAKSLQKKPNIAHPYSPLMTLQDCPGMISLQFKIAFSHFIYSQNLTYFGCNMQTSLIGRISNTLTLWNSFKTRSTAAKT